MLTYVSCLSLRLTLAIRHLFMYMDKYTSSHVVVMLHLVGRMMKRPICVLMSSSLI